MFSKLRQSFRRKSSQLRRRRSLSQHEGDGHRDRDRDREGRSSSSVSRSQSVRSSRTSLTGSAGSLNRQRSGAAAGAGTASPLAAPDPDAQWQGVTASVIESNRVMFNRQLHCDVMFVVGEGGALVGAHRFVLVSRSDVFYRMFCGPLAETGPVVIPDVTEDVFRQFLGFLYVDEVSLSPDSVTPLHYLGRKYDVEPLVQQCLEFLHARLTCDNACSILEQAHCFDEHELYKTSFEFIKENVKACLASVASVHDLCRECLERLLSVEDLDISEHVLFKVVLSWAEFSLEKKQVAIDARNVREELGPLLHLVRFPAMTLSVLKERVCPVGVLSPEEVKAIMEYKERHRSSAQPFEGQGRQRVLRRFQNVSRVRCSNQSETSKWTAAITFSCDRDFLLHSIDIFACTRESQLANVRFSVLQGQDSIDYYNRMPCFHHTYIFRERIDGIKILTIPLQPPPPLEASVDHTLILQANMAACFAGTDGMACVACDDVSFRFRDARVKLNGTTVSEGQIPSFVFSVR